MSRRAKISTENDLTSQFMIAADLPHVPDRPDDLVIGPDGLPMLDPRGIR